ncbi:hypothetical protein MLAC_41340 [Mycobacterium lacus]|uniref:Uncharacterized protein n=1 Tax=Mycobacterium lacus TaxID=169765 RepID=A0A7I7NQN1_9MYCO|nr:hypothetical protein MLAC_41340 [Mycobacterium lacus]
MIWVQYGPITIAVRSTTRTPASGPGRSLELDPKLDIARAFLVGITFGEAGKHLFTDGIDPFGHILDRP